MKKSKAIITAVAVVTVGAAALTCYRLFSGDTKEKYLDKVNSIDCFENKLDDALPQTDVYTIIKSHFESALPEGKTVKKAIVIGYDGCRLDALTDIAQSKGAIKTLLDSGAKAYISYCGGVKYPEKPTQATSTAPGWCSMLTGCWADVHKITDNGIVKSNEHLTLLTTLVEEKTVNKSAFYVSWGGHFSEDNATYKDELKYTEEKNLDVSFVCSDGDDGTIESVISDIDKPDCSDFIFAILEHCDHAGHTDGFFTDRQTYKKAFSDSDAEALKIIERIKSRDTYDAEDWLILITSDHGGKGRSHGGSSIQERYTFIVKA
ncbi:MAG: alkaline phosphatase family protein [Acutalibacteraceae bacterium]